MSGLIRPLSVPLYSILGILTSDYNPCYVNQFNIGINCGLFMSHNQLTDIPIGRLLIADTNNYIISVHDQI